VVETAISALFLLVVVVARRVENLEISQTDAWQGMIVGGSVKEFDAGVALHLHQEYPNVCR
jgi:hypothetical protein